MKQPVKALWRKVPESILIAFFEDKGPLSGNKETEWHKCVDAFHRYMSVRKSLCVQFSNFI